MRIRELYYSNTNTYLIQGEEGCLLFDTGWAGTFPAFCHTMGDMNIPVQDIDYILISHYHPDHMGIAQEIADLGPVILVADIQRNHIHNSDSVFTKEGKTQFCPIRDSNVRFFPIREGRSKLKEIGIDGQVIHTPGHSDDSISLLLDDGSLFVGDLNPLYEVELHRGTLIEDSWNKLMALAPKTVYYGHAKSVSVSDPAMGRSEEKKDLYAIVAQIMKLTDKGYDISKIRKKMLCDESFIQDVMRMYLTHQNVGVQGILDRIEIKNR